jgi:hypothetical protein
MDSLDQLSEEVSRNRGIVESTLVSPAGRTLQPFVFPACYIGKTIPRDNPKLPLIVDHAQSVVHAASHWDQPWYPHNLL